MRLSAAVVLACLLIGGAARASEHHHHHEHKADARKHLERANALAGEGKCAAAVKEYTAAYDILQDPVVLFNRAECHRQLGQNAEAAADYRGFLKGFPAAPNRVEIEARIATLEKPAPARPPAGAPKPPSGASAPVARAPVRPPATTPPPPSAPSRATAPPPVAAAPKPAAAAEPMPFLPPPPSANGEGTTLVEAPRTAPAEAPRAEASHGSHWWIWTTLAVVAVGGGVAAYWFLRPKDEPLPPTSLGNYRF